MSFSQLFDFVCDMNTLVRIIKQKSVNKINRLNPKINLINEKN